MRKLALALLLAGAPFAASAAETYDCSIDPERKTAAPMPMTVERVDNTALLSIRLPDGTRWQSLSTVIADTPGETVEFLLYPEFGKVEADERNVLVISRRTGTVNLFRTRADGSARDLSGKCSTR